MRTQSLDTSAAFERIQIAPIRTFSAAKKFVSTRSWTQSIISASLHCSSDSSGTEWQREQAVSFVAREYSEPLVSLFLQALHQHSEWSLQAPDIQEVMLPLLDVAQRLDVPALLIGSVAGSIYGFPRSVHDGDLMADFPA